MKKISLIFIFTLFIFGLNGQDLCKNMFPTNEGAILINQCYNKDKKVLNTIRYEVARHMTNQSGVDTEIKFVVFDQNNIQIEEGLLKASCINGSFNLDLLNSSQSNDFMNMLRENPEFIGNFLYYPLMMEQSVFNNSQIDTIEYEINTYNGSAFGKIKLYNRESLNLEEVVVPASIFNAYKIKFDVEIDVYQKNATQLFRITEWYSYGAGIVKLEVFDELYNLVNFSELIVWDI